MRKILLLLLCGALFCVSAIAQSPITGRVVSEKDGSPVAGATVTVRGTKTSTVTDTDGNFRINASPSSTLVISYVGFKPFEVAASGNLSGIRLAEDAAALTEVIVTGYTTTQRKKFSGATATVPIADVRQQPFGSFDQALQGNASGVSVVASSGQPGSNAVVRIRGNGSISGSNTPLYIMDGIQISAADFASLNQGDFENVEILKDAVGTALYGSRGANGVIVITTRRGRAGQIQLNYDSQLGWSKLPEDRLVVMNSSQKIDYELQRGNPFKWTPAEQDSLRKINFNWKDALFQTGVTKQHMISASGGNQTSRLYASLSYWDQEGILKTTGMKRYTARINVDNNIKNWRFGLNLQGGFSKLTETYEASTALMAPLNAIRWANPYERDIDPRTGDYQETGRPTYPGSLTSGQPNPAMELFLNYNFDQQVKGVASSYLEYHIPYIKGLYARTNWGIDYGQSETAIFIDPRTTTALATQGRLTRQMFRDFRYTGTTSLNYKNTFGKHEIDGGVFTEVIKNQSRNFQFTGYGFTNGFTNEAGITPGSTTNASYIPAVSGNGSANGILSYFSVLNYGYAGKYYLTAVARRDGSSRFGINNRFANFGSIGVTWAATEERFLQNTFLDDLRLRASYGTNGNNSGPAGDFPLPLLGRVTYAGANGLSPSAAGNLNLRWETNRTINFGLDFAVLNRRLSGTIELYDRETRDLFYSLPIDPSVSGFGTLPSNFGKLRNRGVELMLKGDVIKSKDFRWTLEGNITYNQNKILDLPKDSVISGNTILAKGFPVNSNFMVPYAGVNPANGNAQYTKRDGSTTMVFSPNDKVILGTSDAPWFGGLSTAFAYKGFDLNAQVNFFLDRYVYNHDRTSVTDPSYFYDNMHVVLLKEWSKPGDITDVPRPSSGTLGGTAPANPFQRLTTRFLEDASFWRLRNVTLGYTFPTTLINKANIRSARIFVQGQNWWTKTKFQAFDPEYSGSSINGAQYPALVQTTLGLSVGF
jgi:TonB-linked SusC/RagA family outer membrane protein